MDIHTHSTCPNLNRPHQMHRSLCSQNAISLHKHWQARQPNQALLCRLRRFSAHPEKTTPPSVLITVQRVPIYGKTAIVNMFSRRARRSLTSEKRQKRTDPTTISAACPCVMQGIRIICSAIHEDSEKFLVT